MERNKVSPTVKGSLLSKRISFLLNGEEKQLTIAPGMTLLELIHQKLKLFGTKSTCNEGDCGSCTVLISSLRDGQMIYEAVNSCIYPAVRIHKKHLITIEGIGTPDNLHPIQKALLDFHGSQCGYCTPGFVMALLALFLRKEHPQKADILRALEGNLCRCTGYDAILQAALFLSENLAEDVSLLPDRLQNYEKLANLPELPEDIYEENSEYYHTVGYLQPHSLDELMEALERFDDVREYSLLNGGTDIFVQSNINNISPPWLIDITVIPELKVIDRVEEWVRIGATATLSETEESPLITQNFPLLLKTISLIASRQIRNLATITGNIGNASPVADTPAVLMVLDAELELLSTGGRRRIKLSEYCLDYKKTVLERGEFITAVLIPLPEESYHFQDMMKAAKRRAVDISTVNSAISIGMENGRLKNVRLAFGGVAPYPALAREAMTFMEGKQPDSSWFEDAAMIAATEFKPISDIRGREEYRQTLIRNHTLRFLDEFKNNLDLAGKGL